jgi:hypothetical protein
MVALAGFEVYRSRESKRLELQLCRRKCLFIYHYMVHPVFGFLNARIQTWFPFPIQICFNGRECLVLVRLAGSNPLGEILNAGSLAETLS